MLLESENRNVTSAGVIQTAKATIRTSSKIFNFFADQTYANKPRAICRELVANAWDSHQMAGKGDTPVEVWLPTLLDPVFRVRDFGLGMSHEFMMGQFMCYADGSTKDSSNVAIGGFGIGSKSPFAYVDQYTVTSVFDGVESVYTIFKDEDGIPAIGLLGQRESEAPNGVEVSFPVKPDDFLNFENAAFEALKFFEPLPIIKNATEGSFEPPVYVSKGKTWGMRDQAGDLAIIMGGIRYPVETNNLMYEIPSDSAAHNLLKYGLDLRVPIGTCSVALSREALSYDDRTIASIRKVCEDVIDEVAESFSTMFDHIDTLWEASTALFKEVGPNRHSDRAKFLSEHAKWRGDKLSIMLPYPMLSTRENPYDKTISETYGYQVWHVEGTENRRGRRHAVTKIGSAKWEHPDKYGFTPGQFAHLIIDDLPQSPKHKAIRKIKEFCEELERDVLVVRPYEDTVLDPADIINGMGNPAECRVILTSELPEPVMERVSYARNINRPKVRMFRYDGRDFRGHWREKRNSLNPGHYGKNGVTEIAYEDQPDSGILVVMEQFIIPRGDIEYKISSGLLKWNELLFVNSGDAKKLKGFEKYEEVFERRKKEALAEYPELSTRLAVADAVELRSIFDFFRRHPDTDFTSRKPLGQIFKLYKQYVEPLNDEQRKLASFVQAKLPARIKPAELFEKFKTKQWKAWRLMGALSHHMDEDDMRLFQENL